MIKCTHRKTTDEPPWLLESNGRATAGCWKRKGQLAWGRGEDHTSLSKLLNDLSLKVGRGRGRKRKASSASPPPPPPPPPLQPLQNDLAHGAISHSTHQDRYVQKKTPCIRWGDFWGYYKPAKAQHESKMIKQFTNEIWTNILINKSQTDQCLPLAVTNWNSALTHWKDLIIVSCQLTVIALARQQLDTSILTSQGRTEHEQLFSHLR